MQPVPVLRAPQAVGRIWLGQCFVISHDFIKVNDLVDIAAFQIDGDDDVFYAFFGILGSQCDDLAIIVKRVIMMKLVFREFIDRDDFAQTVYPHGLGQIDRIKHGVVIKHDIFDHVAVQGQFSAHGAIIIDKE